MFLARARLLGAVLISALLASTASAGEVTVFAAASLRDAVEEISIAWETETRHDVVLSLAGSSALARQIQHGAPADLFISANVAWMDALEASRLIAAGSRVDLVRNGLVLVANQDESLPGIEIAPGFDLAGLLGERHLAMGLVEAVPAGIYGKAALEALGVWEDVAPRVAQTDNVRAALALVSAGEAPLGIVYATDARADETVRVLGVFPEDSHPPIVYPAAVIAGSGNPLAAEFLAYLTGETARAAFERAGFDVVAQK